MIILLLYYAQDATGLCRVGHMHERRLTGMMSTCRVEQC